MNAIRLLQPQLLIGIVLLLVLVAVMLFANRASDRPNPGVTSSEAIGIVLNQKGTCAQVSPNLFLATTHVLCTHGVVLGRKGECVTFGLSNFAPTFTDPKHANMSLCRSRGLRPRPCRAPVGASSVAHGGAKIANHNQLALILRT